MNRTLTFQQERQSAIREEPRLPPNPTPQCPSSTVRDSAHDLERRLSLIRRHGDFTLAYSTAVQPDLNYFSAFDGYISYVIKWGYVHVLGDPVADSSDQCKLLNAFLERFPNAGFYQISEPTARHLSSRRFYVNEMGIDTRIDLPSYDFCGKSKEYLRYAGNWLNRRGYRIEERTLSDDSSRELLALDSRWKLTRRIKSEVRFLNRPLVLNDEPDVRRFFLLNESGKMLAFVFFDPLYSDGRVIGYATAFKRRDARATNGYAEPGIMRTAIEVFQRQGYSILRLGLSPLANIEDREFRRNWFLHNSFRRGFKSWWVNRYFYNLQGHAAFKHRFCGVEEKTYFASRSISNDIRLVGALRFARII